MLVKSLAIGDTLIAGVSSDDLSKVICRCARTIAAAVEQLLLMHRMPRSPGVSPVS
ncbi:MULTISPECIES: hypothetical protein [Rhizobium]|uniref:hypothetical protein n=1 Tax=Rhizobium TaxID=379 RepID=UPI001EF7D3B0|nr:MULTISPECIES: hypothetical protein [Rhizobium]ULJ76194.1 hypothetical protein L2W42_27610 [Rhizobium gallicum]WFU90601.1 hypothetical protein QA644_32060 [Rhizobium sp. CC1099]